MPSSRPVRTDAQLSILHIVAPARFGGLESVVRELATGQARKGHSVRVALVLAPEDTSHPLALALEDKGVEVFQLHIGDRAYLRERRATRNLCRQYHPDVVHTHGYRCDVVDGAVARDERICVVSTCHGFIEDDLRGRVYQWLQRRALRRFDGVVAVSREIERRLIDSGVERERIHFLPNAFANSSSGLTRHEARRLLELPQVPVIGWVGRLSAEKGPDVALDAFARLGKLNARLLFIGSGPEESALRARATALGVSDRVIFRGAVPDAARLFCAFDAFLISSRTEGTPMALLEAMSVGVPIVATSVGGIPDILDASSALIVDSGDVRGMAAALADVLRDPAASRERTHHASSVLAQRFAVEPWLSMYESIYRNLVGAK